MAITPAVPMNSQTPVTPKGPSTGRSSGQQTPKGGGTSGNPAAPKPAPFQPTPQYSNAGAWNQWDDKFVAPHGGFGFDTPNNILSEVSGALGRGTTQRDYYTNQYGAELVKQAQQSGMDPQVFFALGPAAQQSAVQWGTNMSMAGELTQQQRAQYDQQQSANQFRNNQVDQFGNFQQSQMDSLQAQYDQGLLSATGRADYNQDILRQGLSSDLALLGQQQYRNVDLARQGVGIDQNYLNTMRGVTQNIFGIQGEQHRNEQQYINAMIGQLNDRQRTAFDKYNVNDRYAAQQAVDNNRQLGFNARGYEQDIQSAFSNRGIQQRGAVSDAAARGAFGSAGFGDNIQDIYGQYDQARNAATLGLDQANQQVDERDRAIGNARDNLGLDYRGQQTAFQEQQLGFGRAHDNNNTGYRIQGEQTRGTMAGYDKQGAELQNVSKGLDSLAKEYGIKRQDLKNGFDNAVTKLGLDLADTQTQLEQMLSSGNAALIQQGMNFMNQMMAYQ